MEFSIRDDHSSKGAVTNTPLAANPNLLGQKQPRQFPGTRFLFGIAPGGACHTQSVTNLAVGSYSTFSPLPTLRQAVFFLWRFPSSYLARALPGTFTFWSPDFPLCRANPSKRPSTSPRAI